ncbi:MAG: ABC transporter ATP-binding protein [Aigarchaeota archaeon]|nr:ABC transporter ATP-binding protein [Candidatus Pelearchaeum maunauluense]
MMLKTDKIVRRYTEIIREPRHHALRSHKLKVGYPKRIVISGVELEVLPGEFIAVIGPNASGKSTLLKTLAGLLKPLGGVVYLDGREITRWRPRELATKLGVVLTERVNPGLMTAFEVVALGRYSYTGALARLTRRDKEIVLKALESVEAQHLANRRFNELSDGEKQKIMVARALAQEPQIIILDEPTTHLDARNKIEILLLLRRLAREKTITVIVSLHEVELSLRLADKLVIVRDGRAEVFNNPEEFIIETGVETLYLMNDRVSFDHISYTVEVHDEPKRGTPVFVIAGAGKGALVYRLLKRLGYVIRTGILHENDIDYHVAAKLRADIISEKPYQPITENTYLKALHAATSANIIIDASPPIGLLNSKNLELVKELRRRQKRIVKIIEEDDSPRDYDEVCCTLAMLPRILEELIR